MPKLKKKFLCFFTNTYPFGNSETFIENELNYVADQFEHVFVFHKNKSGVCRDYPSNVTLLYIEPPIKSTMGIIKKNFLLCIKVVFCEFFFSSQKTLFRQNIKYNCSHLFNCMYYAEQIKKRLSSEVLNESIFYSYWFFDWNLSLSVLKNKGFIKNNSTRAHGFDLYENNGKENYLPFRKFCFENTDNVFAISDFGTRYLKTLYPKYTCKIVFSKLGTKYYGRNPLPFNTKRIHIVSCSNVNEVKRLHLIIEALNKVSTKILWTHFGDGTLMNNLKERMETLPDNIEVNFVGRKSQKEIFDFYLTNPIDVFVNVSISEGLPVSIMEAISFGIPVIATDVGGTSEVVSDLNGHLLPSDFKSEVLALTIENIAQKYRNVKMRTIIFEFWNQNYNYENNYKEFMSILNK